MERKNGETFEFEGKKLKVVESNDNSGCENCFFYNRECSSIRDVRGICSKESRTDKKYVIFVEAKDEQPQEQAERPRELNLCEILKDCPKGTKLYSTIFGEVEFLKVNNIHQIVVTIGDKYYYFSEQGVFLLKGIIYLDHHGECVLFPSKDQRDWSKFVAPWLKKERFDPKILKPFDKVLVKNDDDITWVAALFSHIIEFHDEVTGNDYLESVTSYCTSSYCIPYNDDTKYLVGTTEEAPEYYRYWEDYPKME